MLMDQERQDGRRHDGADLVYATDNGEASVQGSVDRRIHLDVVLHLLLLRQFQHVGGFYGQRDAGPAIMHDRDRAFELLGQRAN